MIRAEGGAGSFSKDWKECVNCHKNAPLSTMSLCPTCQMGMPEEQWGKLASLDPNKTNVAIMFQGELVTERDAEYPILMALTMLMAANPNLDINDLDPRIKAVLHRTGQGLAARRQKPEGNIEA